MWDCPHCGCMAIAAPLTVCPMCGEDRDMPKTTSGGPSNGQDEAAVTPESPESPEAAVAVSDAPAPAQEAGAGASKSAKSKD